MQSRHCDPMSVIDESLLYDDFDVERFLKSVEQLDVLTGHKDGRAGLGLLARPNFPSERRAAERHERVRILTFAS